LSTHQPFFIIIDLCSLSYIPLIAPSTSDARIGHLAQVADSFIYVLSKLGVTGASSTVNVELPNLVSRIRRHTNLPLAVGFGVSTREQFQSVGAYADGVVIGSKIVTVLRDAGECKTSFSIFSLIGRDIRLLNLFKLVRDSSWNSS